MSETLGELQLRLSKTPVGAGIDAEVLLGYINDRIEQICRSRFWTRLEKQSTLQTVGQYITGTVAIVVGATAGTGAGTVFTSLMTGRLIRIANLIEFYEFTYVSATSFTIERPYEAANNAVAAAFTLWQPVYELPAEVAEIRSLRNPTFGFDLNEQSREWLDRHAAARLLIESPRVFVPAEDSANGLTQIELYPGPIDAIGLPMRYRAQAPRYGIDDTGVGFPDWFSGAAVYAGVLADLYRLQDEQQRAMAEEARYEKLRMEMAGEDARKTPVSESHIADRYTRHRVIRQLRGRERAAFRNWNGTQ